MVVGWKDAVVSARAQRLGIHRLPLLDMKGAVLRGLRRGDLCSYPRDVFAERPHTRYLLYGGVRVDVFVSGQMAKGTRAEMAGGGAAK